MISLVQLLRESQDNPKAIILAGAPGAGKTSILKKLDLSEFVTYNLDNDFVSSLKKAGVTLDLKNATPKERSKAAKLIHQASEKLKDKDLPKAIVNRESFIVDGTSASSRETLERKSKLEEAGYDVFMLYVYTDLERSLIQNQNRFEKSGGKERSLAPGTVMATWLSVTKNWELYKDAFGNNFVSVANTLKDEKLKDIESIIKKYLDPFKPTGTKPKTPAEQARRDKQKAKEAAEIQNLLNDDGVKNIIDGSVSEEEAQSKIKQFLSR
jgi:predicted ABC-type ATPase